LIARLNINNGILLDSNMYVEGYAGAETRNMYLLVPWTKLNRDTYDIFFGNEYGEQVFNFGTLYWRKYLTEILFTDKKIYYYDRDLRALERIYGFESDDDVITFKATTFPVFNVDWLNEFSSAQVMENFIFSLGIKYPIFVISGKGLQSLFDVNDVNYNRIRAKTLCSWQDSLFIGGVYDADNGVYHKRRVIWSEVGSYNIFRQRDMLEVEGWGEILRIEVVKDQLLVFAEDGLYLIKYVGEGSVFYLAKLLDCSPKHSMIVGNKDFCIFYAGNFYIFDGKLNVIRLKNCFKIYELINGADKAFLAFNYCDNTLLVVLDYYSKVKQSYIYVINLDGTLIGKQVLDNISVGWVISSPFYSNFVVFYDVVSNRAYKIYSPYWDVGSTDIIEDGYITVGWTDFGELDKKKRIKKVYVYAQLDSISNLSLLVFRDYSSTYTVYEGYQSLAMRDYKIDIDSTSIVGFSPLDIVKLEFNVAEAGNMFKFGLYYKGVRFKLYEVLVDYVYQ